MAYDRLSDLVGPELSAALAAQAPTFDQLPRHRGALSLIHLSNKHRADGGLLCDALPPEAMIPHRYEGHWRKPLPELSAEPTATEPVWTDGGILERFGNCRAIYG